MTTLVVFWPVHDETVPLSQLVTVADSDLPSIAAANGVRMVGLPRGWALRQGKSFPGAGAYETVLTVTVVVTRIRARQDYYRRVNALAMSGESWIEEDTA